MYKTYLVEVPEFNGKWPCVAQTIFDAAENTLTIRWPLWSDVNVRVTESESGDVFLFRMYKSEGVTVFDLEREVA